MKEYYFVVSNVPDFYGWLLAIYPAEKLAEALQHPGLKSENVDLVRAQWKGFGSLPHKMTRVNSKKAIAPMSKADEVGSRDPLLVDGEEYDYDAERGEE